MVVVVHAKLVFTLPGGGGPFVVVALRILTTVFSDDVHQTKLREF